MHTSYFPPVVILMVAAVIAGAILKQASKKTKAFRLKAVNPLTLRERQMYRLLKKALPNYEVMVQMAFGAIVQPAVSGDRAAWGKIGQKRADFALLDPETLSVQCVVELDDRSHNAEKDAERDALLASAGVKTIRFNAIPQNENELREKIKLAFAAQRTPSRK